MNYELSGNELKLKSKLNKKLGTWMNIQMNELHGIGICDKKMGLRFSFLSNPTMALTFFKLKENCHLLIL
jgi:hypothetical protein